MAQTVDQITAGALRLLKVKETGEALTAEESTDGLQALNEIIEEMNLQNLFQVSKKQLTQTLTSNDGTYTFGTGGDNSTRPLEIFEAYIRDEQNTIDYPCRIISNEEYSRIPFKTVTSSYPYNLYFRADYPLSTVELYPVPSISNTTLYMECRAALSTYTAGSDSVDLPPGYIKYLKYQLAVDISPEYKEASAIVLDTARRQKELIKRTNLKDKPVMINTARRAVQGGYGGYLFGDRV